MDLPSLASAAQRPLTKGPSSATIICRRSAGPDGARTQRGGVLSLRVLAEWLGTGSRSPSHRLFALGRRMGQWSTAEPERDLATLLRLGWVTRRQIGSHRTRVFGRNRYTGPRIPGSPEFPVGLE
jgi:hypothetical protein